MVMTGTAGEDDDDDLLGLYHWNGNDGSPSLAIIDALADLEGVAPTSLDSLYGTIDSTALDDLLGNANSSPVVVEFRRGDYRITVDDDGEITIRAVDEFESDAPHRSGEDSNAG